MNILINAKETFDRNDYLFMALKSYKLKTEPFSLNLNSIYRKHHTWWIIFLKISPENSHR